MRGANHHALLLTALLAASAMAATLATRPDYRSVRADHADAGYLESQTCVDCHPDHTASWKRTFHRTMTQEARPATVQGDFERNNTFEYLGVKAKMQRVDGHFTMTLTFPDGKSKQYTVERTVGSRRIEQYLARTEKGYERLPLAYDLIHKRWMSLNGAFFYPDGDNFFQHDAQWDANCVFCHNVKAQPHYDESTRRFNTVVAELGIACGACHGLTAAHATAAASPLTRSLWRMNPARPRLIVQPEKLSPERSLMVCGHCHGQRVPEPLSRIQQLVTQGDPYNAGEDLSQYFKPVSRDTVLPTRKGSLSFASRFWNNGSPRLTAYEYQGILRSACFIKGKGDNRITCLTCHDMHGGDPKGQITDINRLTDTPCLNCHEPFKPVAALTAHTGHDAASPGSRCYSCHMPRVVQGIMAVHRTHDITIPDPSLTANDGVPNACNLCHLDRSVQWAQAESRRMWPARFKNSPQITDAQFTAPEGPRMLFAGDALTRSLAAEALGTLPDAKAAPATLPSTRWALPYLVQALEDNYPIVRYHVANSLETTNPGTGVPAKPDYLADDARRALQSGVWRIWLQGRGQPDDVTALAIAQKLRKNRKDVLIEVGE